MSGLCFSERFGNGNVHPFSTMIRFVALAAEAWVYATLRCVEFLCTQPSLNVKCYNVNCIIEFDAFVSRILEKFPFIDESCQRLIVVEYLRRR